MIIRGEVIILPSRLYYSYSIKQSLKSLNNEKKNRSQRPYYGNIISIGE